MHSTLPSPGNGFDPERRVLMQVGLGLVLGSLIKGSSGQSGVSGEARQLFSTYEDAIAHDATRVSVEGLRNFPLDYDRTWPHIRGCAQRTMHGELKARGLFVATPTCPVPQPSHWEAAQKLERTLSEEIGRPVSGTEMAANIQERNVVIRSVLEGLIAAKELSEKTETNGSVS